MDIESIKKYWLAEAEEALDVAGHLIEMGVKYKKEIWMYCDELGGLPKKRGYTVMTSFPRARPLVR